MNGGTISNSYEGMDIVSTHTGAAATTGAFDHVTIDGTNFSNLTVKASYVQYKVAGSFNNRVFSGGASYRITPAGKAALRAELPEDYRRKSSYSPG